MTGGWKEEVVELTLLKAEEGYLYGVHEQWDDEVNYEFTDDPRRALRLYGYAPKYLYDYENERQAETLEDACRILKGRMVKVTITTEVTWEDAPLSE